MPAVDPNVYALSIQMQMDSSSATDTLDEFAKNVTNVEQQVSDAAAKAIGSIQNVATSVNYALQDSLKTSESINSTSLDIEKAFSKIGSHIDDMGDPTAEELETLQESFDILKDWVKKIENKNVLHQEEADLLDDESDIIRSILGDFGEIVDTIDQSVRAVYAVAGAFANVMETIAKANDIQEKFVENNYRLYGSMDGIAADVRELGRGYGILEKEALEAYKALADVRTPRDQIDKMTTNLVQINRVTGVGMRTLAEYTKQLRSIGDDAASSELHLNRMQDQMRKAGLSADQMNKILSNTKISVKELENMYGEGSAKYFKESQAAAAGAAQALGYSFDDISNHYEMMAQENTTAILQAGIAGMKLAESAEDQEKIFLAAAKAARKHGEMMAASGAKGKSYTIAMEAYAKSAGYANLQTMNAAIAISKQAEKYELATGKIATLKEMQDQLAISTEEAFDATQRFARSWEDLKEATAGIFKEFYYLIGIILVPMLKWLTRIANAIASVIGFFVRLYDAARNLPILGWLIKWGEEIVGLLLAVAFVVTLVVVAFASLASIGSLIANVWAGAASILQGSVNIMTGMVNAVGRVVTAIFRAIGNALQALGQAVQSVMLPLLALGAAMMMAGIGAWFLSMSMTNLVELGWLDFFSALLMVSIALGVFGGILIGLAYLAMPVIPALLAVGAAILMIGAASWLMGAGLKMAAEAFQMIVDAIGPQSPPLWVKLPLVAAGILAVAYAALIGAPGLIFLSAIMMTMALASWALVPLIGALSTALTGLSGEAITEFADALLASSWKISLAIISLIPAIILLTALSPLLLIAAILILPAAALFGLAAMAIGYGAQLLGTGLTALSEGSSKFKGVDFVGLSYQLMVGGIFLISAGAAFAIGAALIGIGALLLGYGLQALGPGAKALSDVDFVTISYQLMAGSAYLILAGSAFAVSAALIGTGALLLGFGLQALGPGAKALDKVNFATIAKQLAVGGYWLTIGGVAFVAGATLVGVGALILGAGLFALGKGADSVKDADLSKVADDLATAGSKLFTAAQWFIAAGPMLVSASYSIYLGLWWLTTSIDRFKKSIGNIGKISEAFSLLANSLNTIDQSPYNALRDAAESGLKAIPMLEQLADTLPSVADKMQSATDKFKKPVNELTQVLNSLGDAILRFDGVGQNLSKEMESVSGVLDAYSFKLEAASQRIQTAVETKAIPAMTAADNSGIADTVKSEAITQVQVTTDTEGSEFGKQSDESLTQIAILQSLDEKLGILVGAGPNGELSQILALLNLHLPEMASKRGGLSSEMNSWMR